MKRTVSFICLAALLAACTPDQPEWVDPGVPEEVIENVTFTVTATLAPTTKVALDADAVPHWEGNEKIGVALGGFDFVEARSVQFSDDRTTATITADFEVVKGKAYNLRIKTPFNSGDKGVVPADQTSTATSADSRAVSMSASVKVSDTKNEAFVALSHSAAYLKISLDGMEMKDVESFTVISESTIIADGDSHSVVVTPLATADAAYAGIYPSALLANDLAIVLKSKSGQEFNKPMRDAATYKAGSFNDIKFDIIFPRGDGSEKNPYLITSVKGLNGMHDVIADGVAVYFELGADIDMSSIDNWVPLNNTGTFQKMIYLDGKGHKISNLKVVSTAAAQVAYASFFGVLYGKCSNVKFVNASISVGNNTRVGIVGGYIGSRNNDRWGVCENVDVQGKIDFTYTSASTVGGICGNMESKNHDDSSKPKSEIINCHANVEINATNTGANSGVGGLIGLMNMGCSVINSISEGTINAASERTGGITGTLNGESNILKGCINWMSEIKSTYSSGRVGAIAGYGGNTTTCPKSYTRSDVRIDRNGTVLTSLPEYDKTGDGKACVHGESVTNACAAATAAGWDIGIWNLSGSIPVLK